jgi:predicted ATPase
LAEGRSAGERSATTEAVTRLTLGLELLATLPDGRERSRRELDLQAMLGRALIAAKGYAAPATGAAFVRARELCEQVGDTTHLLPVLFGQWAYHLLRAEPEIAYRVAADMLRVAEPQQDAAPRLIAHRVAGATSFWLGRFVPARAHLERALELYDPAQHRTLAHLYMFDPKIVGLDFVSLALLALGYPEQALARGREALAEARVLGHLVTLAPVLQHACLLHQFTQDPATARARAEELLALATRHGFPFWIGHGTFLKGWAVMAQSGLQEGLTAMRDGVAAIQATSSALIVPCYLAVLAGAHGRLGDPAAERALLNDALAQVNRTGERWFEAELHRLLGALLLTTPEPDPLGAEACFQRALAVARGQGARLWELRAATRLARLWAEQGRRAEAYDLLAPVYGWFTEGFDTADLKHAKELLEELA